MDIADRPIKKIPAIGYCVEHKIIKRKDSILFRMKYPKNAIVKCIYINTKGTIELMIDVDTDKFTRKVFSDGYNCIGIRIPIKKGQTLTVRNLSETVYVDFVSVFDGEHSRQK